MHWHILLYMVQCIPKLMFGFPLPFIGASVFMSIKSKFSKILFYHTRAFYCLSMVLLLINFRFHFGKSSTTICAMVIIYMHIQL